MSLPDLVEIVPPRAAVSAELTIPGSKSITNRALVLAALARGATRLDGALWSEDTQVMVDCLGRLGFEVRVEPDPGDLANRRITVVGRGGEVPRAGTPGAPLELHLGNSGTSARFLTALVCLGRGSYRLSGVPRMHERPQAPLFDALSALGYAIDTPNGRLPAVVHGRGPRPGRTRVSAAESSQHASALLLAGQVGRWQVEIVGAHADELPYVEMTASLVRAFAAAVGEGGGRFEIEPDASSGSYFQAADFLLSREPATRGSRVEVKGWPTSGWQIDAAFPKFLPLPPTLSRDRDLGDSIMTAIALAPLAEQPTRFTELGRLRVQECERVVALRTELAKCGAQVTETGDSLTVVPGPLHGAEIETYRDHRMAMCFATLGLVIPGLVIRDPGCVRKTFPNFFAKLAAPPPAGLGLAVLEARTRALLTGADLLVD
jgi:3-phosphoshikimate 1-carboxyvinyltransferase